MKINKYFGDTVGNNYFYGMIRIYGLSSFEGETA